MANPAPASAALCSVSLHKGNRLGWGIAHALLGEEFFSKGAPSVALLGVLEWSQGVLWYLALCPLPHCRGMYRARHDRSKEALWNMKDGIVPQICRLDADMRM